MASLTGKVAIVTGGSGGLGSAIVQQIAARGAKVVVHYARGVENAQKVVSAVEAEGGEALALQADLTQVEEIRQLFQKTFDHFGQLDILVNNSGIGDFIPLTDVTEEQFDATFAVNAKGTFFAIQEAARRMADGGRIINISSAATVLTPAEMAVYAGSKAAVEQFTIAAAKALGKRGITVNTVMPGATGSESFHKMNTPESEAALTQMSPLGRLGEPKDIADIVSFLVSEEGGWLTGQNIRATGGLA